MISKLVLFSFILWYSSGTTFAIWVSRNKIYHIENVEILNWHDAYDYCRNQDMNLLSIKTKDEFCELKNYIKNKYQTVRPYWIGAYKDDGKYKWLAYQEIIEPGHMIWHEGEPNNKSGNELCVHTWDNDFDWNDNDCKLKLPYICEVKVQCSV